MLNNYFVRVADVVDIIDKHSYGDNSLDDDISCILEEIPQYNISFTKPDYDKVQEEIERCANDFRTGGERHADFVRRNAEMIAFGLEMALDIIRECQEPREIGGDK